MLASKSQVGMLIFFIDMKVSKEFRAKPWSQDSLKQAVRKVGEGMSVRSAAKASNIPSTLYGNVSGKVDIDRTTTYSY